MACRLRNTLASCRVLGSDVKCRSSVIYIQCGVLN